jgi:flavin reductase (DIM6/NTAB) family NADH-FMN oxidoreductase RutF
MTRFDFDALAPADRYKLPSSLVVPRPIALVSTRGATGVVNAAPYSFFNVFSEDPALVVLGLQHHADGTFKDTTRNIRDSGVFVVNLVDAELAAAMDVCAAAVPPEASEPALAGLTPVPSARVDAPRLAEAPASLECRRHLGLEVGPGRRLVCGEVLAVHVRAGLVDPATLRLERERYAPVGRLFGDLYCRTDDVFALTRPEAATLWPAPPLPET